ncbi:hypothetical protein K474DRAFT_1275989 [Panus rudis PR-1116 ss-1]|nr:hypothetical protein K474DRAFT_1275989 [Panus rudis PR-1116 ss-1]
MRTKRAVSLVCRSWHNAATPFVYEDIVFRQPGQVAAFARTLLDDPSLGSLVRRITFACYVPPCFRNAVRDCMDDIFDVCPNLQRLICSYEFSLACGTITAYLLARTIWQWDTTVPSCSLTELGFVCRASDPSEYHTYDILKMPPLSIYPNLVSLSLHSSISNKCFPEDLRLENLENLRLVLCIYNTSISEYLAPLVSWHLPKLQHLSFHQTWMRVYDQIWDYKPFFDKHCARLQSLDLCPQEELQNWGPPDEHCFDGMIRACPRLKHVVLPSRFIHDDPLLPFFKNPGNIHVDIWIRPAEIWHRSMAPWHRRLYRKNNIRWLDNALASIPNLPRLFPPRALTRGDKDVQGGSKQSSSTRPFRIDHRIGEIHMIETDRFLCRRENNWARSVDRDPKLAHSLAAIMPDETANPDSNYEGSECGSFPLRSE